MTLDLESILRDAIAGAPLGKLLGVELVEAARDRVRVRLPFRPDLTTVGDLVHGGAIAAVIDVTATATAWSAAEVARAPRGTTIGITVSYLNGARAADLVATGSILQRGQSIVVVDVAVDDAGGTPIARALVTYKLTHRDAGACA